MGENAVFYGSVLFIVVNCLMQYFPFVRAIGWHAQGLTY